jgi:NAD(P)-dependent dehydrogenase (short-subunit alcohol dehydrogenase family)
MSASEQASAGRITSAFDRTATATDVVRGVDMKGRTVLVTGGGAGIGCATACALAAAGATVYIADIDVERSEAAIRELQARSRPAKMFVRPLDLGSLAAVRAFGAAFLNDVPHLDVLINNAGVMACPFGRTVDGHERQFGINFLGHYALTRLLEPALKRARGRVVSVASIGHRRSDINWEDIDYNDRPYDRWEAYGQSKTACSLLAVAVDALWGRAGVHANTLNPGGSPTGLHQYLTDDERRRQGWLDAEGQMPDRWRPPEQCAATPTWLASAPELAGIGGRYFEECQEALPWQPDNPMSGVKPYALSRDSALRLWQIAEEMASL